MGDKLREALEAARELASGWQYAGKQWDEAQEVARLVDEALAADDAAAPQSVEPACRDDGRCQYAIDHGAEGLGHCPKGKCAMPSAPAASQPIDMVLHCPACGMQHIDAPERGVLVSGGPNAGRVRAGWSNPPHRSHLCHSCGHIWRPADVPTNGIQAVATKGKNDSPINAATPQNVEPVAYWPEFPPFPTWISANDLHSLQEWAQTVRRDAFAAGMQRAAQQSAEPVACVVKMANRATGESRVTVRPVEGWKPEDHLREYLYLAPPSVPTDAAWRAENERLRVALRFYARGEHYNLDESEEFDTVSGEPENWLCSGLEDSATMIETGRVALSALQGVELSWLDGDEDCTPQPVEGEKALRAHLSTRPAQAEEWIACSERMPEPDSGEVLVWLWESKMYALDEWHTHREDPTGMGGPTLDMGLMWRNFDFDEVSHWRPLPAPPTKTKEPGA